jgi:hypothetical protein
MLKYIHENSDSIEHKEWEQTLREAAGEMDAIRDKILDDINELHVEALIDGHPVKIS